MARRHQSGSRPKPKPIQQKVPAQKISNVLQTNHGINESIGDDWASHELSDIKSLLIDDSGGSPKAGTSSAHTDATQTASLHDELDTFRRRWKRELEIKKTDEPNQQEKIVDSNLDYEDKENKVKPQDLSMKEFYAAISNPPNDPEDVYALAKKLFLMGVQLEQDELHYESIRYYKQAMHLYPDIERQIFREQSDASKSTPKDTPAVDSNLQSLKNSSTECDSNEEKLPLYERISSALKLSFEDKNFSFFHATSKHKPDTIHISELPHDLLLQIIRYVVGQGLDLASLETLGLVCRGFFLLSRDNSLWRSICYHTWGTSLLKTVEQGRCKKQIDWRRVYLEKPRVNYDGVYISRTRYIRQGDVGFQDMTYRPFHVIRYYRYLRFFPDKRVLILTTNEEPERIIPIFRHALYAKQFSFDLSILEGSYDLVDNTLVMVAEKDFANTKIHNQPSNHSHKRHARFHWSRQTPLLQKFDYRFELKTLENRPYRNNILKWNEYSITTTLETGQEMTTFDLTPDSFPNLSFSRVKSFNLRQTEPLPSH